MILFDTFKDTIFLKDSTELEKKCIALEKLNREYPNNDALLEELYIIRKGISGENEIKYQLEKSNLGLFVLRDVNIEYENLKAQIDFIVITRMYCYFIECKNLIGNITINENGDFIREFVFDNKKYKKGMYSPLRQVEAQRDVYKKIWNNKLSSNKFINFIKRTLSEKNFADIHKVLVVVANHETIMNTKYAPNEIKNKVIRADNLIRRITEDLSTSDKSLWDSKSGMEEWANTFLAENVDINIDYYNYYKNKFFNNMVISDTDLEKKLIEFRKIRSQLMGIPAYYVFNNEELKALVENRPKDIQDLKDKKILSPIRIKTHGELIIQLINMK